MKEVNSPSQRHLVKLPPQKSATDTSNWDNRNVAAPTVDKLTKKRIVRDTVFIKNKTDPIGLIALTEKQLEKLEAQKRTK
jgi:predicted DNA binding protein